MPNRTFRWQEHLRCGLADISSENSMETELYVWAFGRFLITVRRVRTPQGFGEGAYAPKLAHAMLTDGGAAPFTAKPFTGPTYSAQRRQWFHTGSKSHFVRTSRNLGIALLI